MFFFILENRENNIRNGFGLWLDLLFWVTFDFIHEYVVLYSPLFGVYSNLQSYKEHDWVLFWVFLVISFEIAVMYLLLWLVTIVLGKIIINLHLYHPSVQQCVPQFANLVGKICIILF